MGMENEAIGDSKLTGKDSPGLLIKDTAMETL